MSPFIISPFSLLFVLFFFRCCFRHAPYCYAYASYYLLIIFTPRLPCFISRFSLTPLPCLFCRSVFDFRFMLILPVYIFVTLSHFFFDAHYAIYIIDAERDLLPDAWWRAIRCRYWGASCHLRWKHATLRKDALRFFFFVWYVIYYDIFPARCSDAASFFVAAYCCRYWFIVADADVKMPPHLRFITRYAMLVPLCVYRHAPLVSPGFANCSSFALYAWSSPCCAFCRHIPRRRLRVAFPLLILRSIVARVVVVDADYCFLRLLISILIMPLDYMLRRCRVVLLIICHALCRLAFR